MKQIWILALAILLTGCVTRKVQLSNFETGEVLIGKFTDSPGTNGKARVTMPDGEVLEGTYSAIRGSESVAFGSAFSTVSNGAQIGTALTYGSSYSTGGSGKAYAILKSTKPGSRLMMEIIASYGVLSGHGFGEARTNDGRAYKITF